MRIATWPVYSKLADSSQITQLGIDDRLPTDLHLSQHQAETFRALRDPNVDVVLNTAMTGDGKSLAAYLPVVLERQYAFGMYPTIELSRDQARQFEDYLHLFGLTPQQIPHLSLWGAELTRLQEKYDFRSRGDFLKERFTTHNVILTNPDIFNLVMNYTYARGSRIFNDQELPYSLCTNFDYFVFDEFHVFGMPQIVSALTAMLYIANQSGYPHKFVFSSATMSDTLIEMIKRSGLRYREISGAYRTDPAPGYRQVLYPATLNVHQLKKDTTAEDWVREHIGELVAFWKACAGNAKGAIILNSVVAARRVAHLLAIELALHGISVGENTGLTDDEQRRVSLEKHLVVGTSTIDVGVDFNINLLIFESINAGTFLQRLGRLGRVKRDQAAFPRYEAHALISGKTPWIYERLKKELSERGVNEGDTVERSTVLHDAVNAAFPNENDFLPYAKRWGILQAAHVLNILASRREQGAYTSLVAALKDQYRNLFDVNTLEPAQKRYWAIHNHEERGRKILDEVLAFRGSSPFQVACWDATVEPNTFLSYDLLPLIQSANYTTAAKEEYQRAVAKRYADSTQQREALDMLKYTLGNQGESPLIVRIEQFHEEREKLVLKIGVDLSLHSDHVVVLSGFAIEKPRTSIALTEVNRVLRRQSFVCYVTRMDRGELRRRLHLPALFPLYTMRDMHRHRDYTVAFGKAALLLDSVMLRFKNKNVENEPIIL